MRSVIQIRARNTSNCSELRSIYQLRAKVFQGRLGWEVAVVGGLEIGGYDTLDACYRAIGEDKQQVRGCWRLLPTTGPYMLKDTFPELLHGRTAQEREQVWELSRFAIDNNAAGTAFGFADLARQAMREIVRFASDNGIVKYVTVTTTSIQRLLRHSGIEMNRFGPLMQIAVEHAAALQTVNSSMDQVLTKHADMVPGIGAFGDRYFGAAR